MFFEVSDTDGLISLDIGEDEFSLISLDIYCYHGQKLNIDLTKSISHKINSLQITVANYAEIAFKSSCELLIDNLIIKSRGVKYLGGVAVNKLEIISGSLEIDIVDKNHKHLSITEYIEENDKIIGKLLKAVNIIPGSGMFCKKVRIISRYKLLRIC